MTPPALRWRRRDCLAWAARAAAAMAGGAGWRSAAAAAQHEAAEATDARQRSLCAAAEQSLAAGRTEAALAALERAALLGHSPQVEMTQVRAMMQAGAYRRALAFCAHAAGAHREAPAAAGLYAWLLSTGGQKGYALRVLGEARQRAPRDRLLAEVQQALDGPAPRAAGRMLAPPHRLAPQALPAEGVPPPARDARVLATGLLLPGGAFALAPVEPLGEGWRGGLCNGLGRAVEATMERPLGDSGLALLRLAQPLPAVATSPGIAAHDPHAGSPGYLLAHVAGATAPQWPWLQAGFVARWDGTSPARGLGIETLPGAVGAAVFDAGGQWAGMLLRHGDRKGNGDGDGAGRWVRIAELRPLLGALLPAQAPAPQTRPGADEIYEQGLPIVLQVFGAAHG